MPNFLKVERDQRQFIFATLGQPGFYNMFSNGQDVSAEVLVVSLADGSQTRSTL